MADDQVENQVENQETTQPLIEPPPAASVLLPESDDDSSVEEVHTGPHLTPKPNPVSQSDMIVLLRYFGLHAFVWLHTFWNWLSYAAGTTQVITMGVVRSLQSKTYVFFKDSNYPYRLQEYSVSGPGVPPVDWYYDADKKLFVSSNLYDTNTDAISHHFEWLSAEIQYNGLVLYDISDFIEDARWAGVGRPSAARILAAWSLHSGIVLQFVEGLTLHTINEDGSESVMELRVQGA